MLPEYLSCLFHHGFAAAVRSTDNLVWSPIANYCPFLMVWCWSGIWRSLCCCKWWDTPWLWIIFSENHYWNLAGPCSCFYSLFKMEFGGCWFVSFKLPPVWLSYMWGASKQQMKKCSVESTAMVLSSVCFCMFRVNLTWMQLACEIPYHIS